MNKILETLQSEIHTTIMATVDEQGHPITCAIDLMLYKEDKLYFLTARGKPFYDRLMKQRYIALTGMKGKETMSTMAISLQGEITPMGHQYLEECFAKNPYMAEIYPDENSRDVLEVFEITRCHGEYFDLSKTPIERGNFSCFEATRFLGYVAYRGCIGCKMCSHVCPQKCIDSSAIPVVITQSHCLHCGKCKEVCPVQCISYEEIENE